MLPEYCPVYGWPIITVSHQNSEPSITETSTLDSATCMVLSMSCLMFHVLQLSCSECVKKGDFVQLLPYKSSCSSFLLFGAVENGECV